jgi:sugar (pentulose or hexulose) kinase
MAGIRHVAVIDIGKTNAKVALVDLDCLSEVAVRKTPNIVLRDGPYPHHDVERLWSFILDGLAGLRPTVDALSITTHGATAALLDGEGNLALPVLDYEHEGPDLLARNYNFVRPDFSESGTPRLTVGLNLGAQIFWQSQAFPDRFAEVASILMYPQYWAFRLTGIAANEVTSLGCHTDLWNPSARDYSSLVDQLGWRRLMAPVRPASDRLGPLLPAVLRSTGLDPATPVLCGIHDSNASLLPHLMAKERPFSVVSTGTWVIAMAVGGPTTLDPARDTLVNVSADGEPVPSARFMGGRDYEIITEGRPVAWAEDDVDAVLQNGIFLLPSVQDGSGPFPHRKAMWLGGELTPARRHVAVSFYLALMTAVCQGLINATGETIVEGPFAANDLYVKMLASATGRIVRTGSSSGTGTSIGAALLAAPAPVSFADDDGTPIRPDSRLALYAERWMCEIDARG